MINYISIKGNPKNVNYNYIPLKRNDVIHYFFYINLVPADASNKSDITRHR